MDDIREIIEEIEETFDVRKVGGIFSYDDGGDIDFYLKPGQRDSLSKFLLERGFVMRNVEAHGVSGCIFLEGNLYVLDFTDVSKVILAFYPDVDFKPAFYTAVWKDEKLERFMRYSLQLRRHKTRYSDFVRDNFEEYGRFLSDSTYLTKPVFRKTVTSDDVVRAMFRKPRWLLKAFPLSRLARMFYAVFRIHLRQIGHGEIVAFVGADGAGKSTALEKTWQIMGAHYVYMGDVNFRLENVHNFLFSRPTFVARLVYILMYLENWFRYAWILSRKLKGDLVYTDRWPGLNQHLKKSDRKAKIHDVLYKFYPDADRYVFLSGDPALIHERKPELLPDEINVLQTNLRERLISKECAEITSESLDETLTNVLTYLMKTRWNNTY